MFLSDSGGLNMKIMYAPWRHSYVSKSPCEKDNKNNVDSNDECVFCKKFGEKNDQQNLILKRFKHSFAILNAFPYNAGHVMVLPNEHKPELTDLDKDVRTEMMEVVNVCIQSIKDAMRCEGFNVGINTGIAGGGGLPKHLHIHVLPRWTGDTNFITTTGNVKLICSEFDEIYKLLKERLDKIEL
jgi:ATP adenylyltransferase